MQFPKRSKPLVKEFPLPGPKFYKDRDRFVKYVVEKYNEIPGKSMQYMRIFFGSAARVIVAVTVVAFWLVVLLDVDFKRWVNVEENTIAQNTIVQNTTSTENEEPECNVYGEVLHGMLDTYAPDKGSAFTQDVVGSDAIVRNINSAAASPEIKAVLLDIDSSGGTPVAADEIAKALNALDKPSVAVIHGYGDSAAYWVATGADVIFAHPLSDVGSIGITSSYLENTRYNNKEGYTYQQLSMGKYKDLGDPNKPLTAEEKQLVMKQLEENYNYFIQTVATNRNMSVEEVKKLATGESWTGTEALKLKLIDKLGGLPEATKWLEEKIGAKPEFCW